MSVQFKESSGSNVLGVLLTGKLVKEDYEQFIPVLERFVAQYGKIRMFIEMRDFHGWTAGALWQDLKLDVKHFNNIERIAIVGETKWQHTVSVFAKPFSAADVRYFDQSAAAEAHQWVESP